MLCTRAPLTQPPEDTSTVLKSYSMVEQTRAMMHFAFMFMLQYTTVKLCVFGKEDRTAERRARQHERLQRQMRLVR